MPRVIRVRSASEGDLADVAMLATEGWRNAYRGLISGEAIDVTLRQWYSTEELRRRLSRGGLEVAEWEGRTVGFVQHGPVSDRIHEVFAIYVLPSLMSKGVGWAMWQKVLSAARLAGKASIELWVLQGKQARH